jgi:diacylglycerol O-acyltransferase
VRQLTGVDTGFLIMETPTTFGHVAWLSLFDPGHQPTAGIYERTKKTLEERLHLLPPYRWRLAEVPLGIDRPYWFNDPDFDIDFHVRHLAVPPPGDNRQLADLVARLHSRPLDRARPMWEFYVIEGLRAGRIAQYMKMQHATIDGVSGANAATLLLDLSPEGSPVPPPEIPWQPDPVPSQVEMFLRGVGGLALQPARALRYNYRLLRALPGMRALLPPLRRGGEQPLMRPSGLAPRTSFNRKITPHRRWAFGTSSLSNVKLVKNTFGTTVNDVVVAVCAGALRRYLTAHRELPADPLLAMVPVSIRSEHEKHSFGNRVAAMIAPLGTHLVNPVERLRFCQQGMQGAKEQFHALPADLLTDAAQFLPPALAGLAARTIARTRIADYVNPPFNVVISNVPGPRQALYSSGCEMSAMYPVSAITDGVGLNMTVVSYRDTLAFGFLSCRELMPDLWDLATYFQESLAELARAAQKKSA